jgi:hypothetical protein
MLPVGASWAPLPSKAGSASKLKGQRELNKSVQLIMRGPAMVKAQGISVVVGFFFFGLLGSLFVWAVLWVLGLF